MEEVDAEIACVSARAERNRKVMARRLEPSLRSARCGSRRFASHDSRRPKRHQRRLIDAHQCNYLHNARWHRGSPAKNPPSQDQCRSMRLTSPVEVDEVVFATQAHDSDNGVLVAIDNARRGDPRAARAAAELGRPAASIERLPFDLSVLDSGGVFINVDASNF